MTFSKAGGKPPITSTIRTSIVATAVIAASCALAACAGTHVASILAEPALPRPVTTHQAGLLDRAQQILVRSCMKRHGFRFWVVASPGTPPGARFPYVVDDAAWAGRHGYGTDLARRLAERGRHNPNHRYFSRLSPARQSAAVRAINGARPQGLTATLPNGIVVQRSDRSCTSDAQRRLYGDLETWYRASEVTDNLFGLRVALVNQDPAFLTATKRWAQCMRRNGHPYASPADARAALTQTTSRRSRSIERRVAVAEATCARDSGLADVATRLDRHYAGVVRHRYFADVAARRRLELAALPRAAAIDREARRSDTNLNDNQPRGAA